MSNLPQTPTPINVIERQDEQGTFCLVWQDGQDEAQAAQYDSLEQAAGVIMLDSLKTAALPAVVVHGDNGEVARFNRAAIAAMNQWYRMRAQAAAPRDKRSGRALFTRK